MKYRFTVTVDLEDPDVYDLDSNGWPVGDPEGRVEHVDVAEHICDAVRIWGGAGPPGGPFWPGNIRNIRVKGKDVDIKSER